MTRKLFWEDPYRTTATTTIATAIGDTVTVAETLFYAESGGQESDRGTIGGHEVLEARKDGTEISYRLPPEHGLAVGQAVDIEIDWERRYRLMRLHFAAEVVLELVYRDYGPVEKTGAHIAEDKARIDFAWDGSISPILPELQTRAQAIFDANQPITSAYSDRAAERRYWQIDGFAQVPCAGTHLKRTGEVGTIKLKRRNPGKGRERIEIAVVDSPT